MKILLLDNYDSFTHNLARLLEESDPLHRPEVVVVANDRVEVGALSVFDKIVLSPGPGIPSEAGKLLEVIKAWAGRRSILGICLGHQALAEAFGGRLVNLAQVFHGRVQTLHLCQPDYLWQGLPPSPDIGLYHSWAVEAEDFPAQLAITALNENGRVMALKHRHFDIRGLQFHPESVMTPSGGQMIRNWLRYPGDR
ncbi:MAG: aminodeoxychorismate/anthranilate synthase component II [Microscillaceae bacterium]